MRCSERRHRAPVAISGPRGRRRCAGVVRPRYFARMNPYQPPKTTDLAAPADPKPAVPRPQKMPGSHKWALVCFIILAGVNLMLNAKGHFDTVGILVTIASLAAIVSVLFFRRSPRSYGVGVIALGFVLLRAGQSTFFQLAAQIRGTGAGWIYVAGVCWVFFLLILLFRAYTLGSASRRYYGLPTTPNPKNA
jgi:hypothetical protein